MIIPLNGDIYSVAAKVEEQVKKASDNKS